MARAVKTARTNSIRFAGGEESDFPYVELPVACDVTDNHMTMTSAWDLTAEERMAIAEGALLTVTLHGASATHPPLSVTVSHELRDVTP